MSGHVEERLGAYLDAELAEGERAEVTAHLRECAGCARLLEEMSAVDDTARSLTVEPPEGYFDTFATRLGRKLRKPARPRFVLPVWTLAAAAALLLAVLTPLTLRQRKATAPEDAEPAPRDRAPRAAQQPEALAPSSAGESLMLDEAGRREDAGSVARRSPEPGTEPAGSEAGPRDLARRTAPEQPAVRAPFQAAEEMKKRRAPYEDKRAAEGEADRRPQVAGGVAEAPPAASQAPPAAAPLGEAQPASPAAKAPAPLAKTQPTPPPPARRAAPHDRPEFAAEPPSLVLDEENEAPSSTAVAKQERVEGPKAAARERQKADGSAAARTTAASRAEPTSGAEARYRALLARRPSSVEEARALRESWRAFAQSEPTGPRADEARVRVIEVGAQAFRLSGEEQDRATVAKDANAYLARPDAAQTERVRTILTTLTR
jgi:hypothetical protein